MATLLESKVLRARVYCPICTRTVEADVVSLDRGWNRKMRVAEGQKCPRCSAALDAAYVLDVVGNLNG
ncbi:MAG: hypothetical protein HY238_12390 [Acidobacteria bacterium]|nr:hypothetical protein [Acidobacteriota bacterium]